MANRLKAIKALKELAEKLELENREIIRKYTMAELNAIYNGIGPDAFPEWLRNCISSLHPTLAVAAFIHDIEWHESDFTEAGFEASNKRFKRNGYKAAKAEYGWYNPKRYIVMNQARRFGNICQTFGRDGWFNPCQCKVCKKAKGKIDA